MSDIHALSGAYAVEALDDLERERFERHLAECGECRAEVDSLREAGATLAELVATPPPGTLRESVLAGISTVRPLPPVVPWRGARLANRFPRLLVAAAAVIALFGVGLVVAQPWEKESSPTQLTAAELVVHAADARSLTVEVEDAEATLYVSDSLGKAALVTEGLPDLPRDKVYELWLQKDGVMQPAGLLTNPDEPFLLEGGADDAIAAGMTVEPAGGSKKPTLPVVAIFPFEEVT